MNDITIVTAFFDIGRGNISTEHYPSHLKRTTNTYFEYFSYLATLDNNMVIFTEEKFKEKILMMRKSKPTTVICLNIFKKFNHILAKIADIQSNHEFLSNISQELSKNIEYWNSQYVLVTNLKTYFVNYAINHTDINSPYVAWVDFGYVRNKETLNNIKQWRYPFSKNKLNLFSIKKHHVLNDEMDVLQAIYQNNVYIIGGSMVATSSIWKKFKDLVIQQQTYLLNNNIVDDDQGIFMMCLYKQPELFQINYLGRNQWFSLFKKYDETSRVSITEKIKDHFGL